MIQNLDKGNKNSGLIVTLTLFSVFAFVVIFSAVGLSMVHAQTAIPNPKHTPAYITGVKDGLAAAKAGKYNVAAACASHGYSGSNLDHCIAGYYDAVTGYHDARVVFHAVNQSNATNVGGVKMTKSNISNTNASSNKSS
jgi:hypothetical protein